MAALTAADADMVDEDDVSDVEDTKTWLYLDGLVGTEWDNMAAFTESVDGAARARLTEAINGKGAFSRFRRAVDELDLRDAWHRYADDRRWGRTRDLLADHGIRSV